MPIPVQAIYRDVPGALPATYDAPSSLDVEFASSRIKFSGAGASGAFVIVLEALTNDGRVMVAARTDQVFSVGDTGVVSWAPFLRRRAVVGPWSAAIFRSAVLNIANNTFTFVTGFDNVIWDNANMVDLATNDDRITIRNPGYYVAAAHCTWSHNAVGNRKLLLEANGATLGTRTVSDERMTVTTAGFFTNVLICDVFKCEAGDTFRVEVFQNSGGPLRCNEPPGNVTIEVMGIGPF